MIEARTVTVSDPLAQANVVQALAGAGAPVGVVSCTVRGETIELRFDSERTAPELIDALIAVAVRFGPSAAAPPLGDFEAQAATAAAGLNEPQLDGSRIIETYLA